MRRLVAWVLVLAAASAAAAPAAAAGSLEEEIAAATGLQRTVAADLQARAAVRAVQIQVPDPTHTGLTYGEGEVIAWSTYPDDQLLATMVAGWLASPGHATVLRNPDYSRIGCALAFLATEVEGITGSAGWYGVCILSALPAPTVPIVPTVPDAAMPR